jgi:uracil-DNA glycosylase
MRPSEFVAQLASVHLRGVFNPYADRCQLHDSLSSPKIRRQNLVQYLTSLKDTDVDVAWLGRDLGYRGGRRTGLALTDEAHLPLFRSVFGAAVKQATIGPPVLERTATEIWRLIPSLASPPLLWNVFPLHPFSPDGAMSNRCHTPREFDLCRDLLSHLLEWLRPRRLVALGLDAHKALTKLGYRAQYVRHPSYGGQRDFVRGISELYGSTSSV